MRRMGFVFRLIVVLVVTGLFGCVSVKEQLTGNNEQSAVRTDGFEVEVFAQLGHNAWIQSIAFSSDGKYILSGSDDGTVKLWDAATGRKIRTLSGHNAWVQSIAFSPDGKQILSGSSDKTVKLWDTDSGREIRTFLGHSTVTSLAFSPDGRQAISGSLERTIKLWDIATGNEIKTFLGHTSNVISVAFSPDGQQVLSGSYNRAIKLWNIETGREIRTFSGHSDQINSVAFSPDGKQILSGSIDRTVKLWNIDTGREIRTFTGHSNVVTSITFSPDGQQVLSGSYDRTIKLWDTATGIEIKTFSGHSDVVTSVAFSPDGKQILSGSWDRTIKLWDIPTGSETRTFYGHSSRLNIMGAIADERQIFSNTWDGSIKLWDTVIGQKISTFTYANDFGRTITFSPNGRQALSRSDGGTIKLWDTATGYEIRTFTGHSDRVQSIAFSPDSRQIIAIYGGSRLDDDITIKLWDTATGQEIKTFTGHADRAFSVAFSPDGRKIISETSSGIIRTTVFRIWDTSTGKEIRTFKYKRNWINVPVAFSPDGKKMISGYWRTINLWDITTGNKIRIFSEHSNLIRSITFSPNGQQVLSGSEDGNIKLWDTDTGKEIKTFSGHSGWVNSVSFTPCGTRILSASRDGTTRLWDISTGKEIASFISFTDGEWIVITPDGYYNSSPKGDQHLNVRIGNEVYGMDQFADTFYQPEVVQARLQGLPDPPVVRQRGSIQTTSIPPAIRVNASEVDAVTRQVTLSVSATDWIRQINNIEIIVNGRRIGGEELLNVTTTNLTTARAQLTPASDEKQFEFTIPLTLDPGANHIEIVASNGYNFGLRPLYLSASTGTIQRKGDLWVFSVGVDRYVNNNADSGYLDLRNASNDARNIVHSFRAQERKRYDKVHVMCLADNEPILPTKQAIMNNMNEFFNKASPHDTVVLFMSGHGKTEDGIYYFMPRDTIFSGEEKFVLTSVISAQELSDALNIPGRKIVMLDTCESGGVDSNRLAHSLRNRSTVVFTASQDGEFALDTGLYGGLLAYSVVEGVGGKAAQAGTVQIEPLGKHVTDRVRELSRDRQSGVVRQTPVVYFPDWYRDFVIAW